jgi:6-methylsalicylate decarboxylase
MSIIDVHQHVWADPLVQELSRREELPFVRTEHELTILYAAGERPYVLDVSAGDAGPRRALLDRDGIDRALVCISSPLGIEALPRAQALGLIDAYHAGALALGDRFGVWGSVPIDRPQAADVDRALELGCVGVSLPAGAIGTLEDLVAMGAVLDRLQERGAPLFVHPGPGRSSAPVQPPAALGEPLWWPALTTYVAQMQSAWLAFAAAGRQAHPDLRVVFSMFAGLAPLQCDRLQARGGPRVGFADPNTFYECSSYGPETWAALESKVGASQLLFGSDRPMARPESVLGESLSRWQVADNTRRALAEPAPLSRPQRPLVAAP